MSKAADELSSGADAGSTLSRRDFIRVGVAVSAAGVILSGPHAWIARAASGDAMPEEETLPGVFGPEPQVEPEVGQPGMPQSEDEPEVGQSEIAEDENLSAGFGPEPQVEPEVGQPGMPQPEDEPEVGQSEIAEDENLSAGFGPEPEIEPEEGQPGMPE